MTSYKVGGRVCYSTTSVAKGVVCTAYISHGRPLYQSNNNKKKLPIPYNQSQAGPNGTWGECVYMEYYSRYSLYLQTTIYV
jgi:hypothetical protein